MIVAALSVFVLGLRHGADPDHLAIIDNLTRNAHERAPRGSRFIGALFAGGHSVMVLAIAALVGLLGTWAGPYRALIEQIGAWTSVAVLLFVAVLNLYQLAMNDVAGSPRTRIIPLAWRTSSHVLIALPTGMLFGLGFETSSQLATYAIAFGAGVGILGAVLIGLAFCLGIVCTDTLDGFLVHRFISLRASAMRRAKRTWLIAITLFAIAVAVFQLAQLLGWEPPFPDIVVSAVLMLALFTTYGYLMLQAGARSNAPAEGTDLA
jgi:nickel/cobalt transporter (NiCoT) family protein